MSEPLVLGLVATLTREPHELAQAMRGLAELPGVTLGEARGHKLPFVVETEVGDDEDFLARARAVTGVLLVDVAFAQFDHDNEGDHGQA